MRDLIDLRIDYAFKLIFGKEGHEAILMAFLNAALKLTGEQQITGITLMNPELNKEYAEDKKSILDVRAKTGDGIQFNVEIQLKNDHDMEKRALYYWAELYTRQMQAGMDYGELKRTVSICILNFNYLKQTTHYHSLFRLREETEKFQLTDHIEINFMELPKLLTKWQQKKAHPQEDALEKWLLLLESSENEEILTVLEEIAVHDPVLKQAINAWEETSIDPKVREAYYDRRKAILDEKAAARRVERLMAEAVAEARAEARAEAVAEGERKAKDAEARGLSEGKAKGIAEGKEMGQRDLIINLWQSGMKPEEIAQMTKVPLEHVREIVDTVK